MTYAATDTPYRDPRRSVWLMSLIIPFLIGAGPILYYLTNQSVVLWFPVILSYVILPILDFGLGEDTRNPPESAVPDLEADLFYRYITYALVPILWLEVTLAAWFVSHTALDWQDHLAVILSTGLVGGFCINVGHELGHKKSRLERWLAILILAPTAYGHFYVEHNRGHHRDVSTPLDPASSRMGEPIYRFVLREMPGAFVRAWRLEWERLIRLGYAPWHWRNQVLVPITITIVYWAVLLWFFGPFMLVFLPLMAFWSNFQLTSANYIEHYGILRQKMADGRYEIVKPHHSWNSNHFLSNWILFHLQRHSDHHANPARRYQALRHFDGLPTLPSGYFGMFLLAYVPPLWFRVMNPRLVAAMGHDRNRINFDPKKKRSLLKEFWP